MFFPLILAAAFHGFWTVGLMALTSVLVGYMLAVLPNLLVEGGAAPVFFRLSVLGLAGGFVLVAPWGSARGMVGGGFSGRYATDEGGSMLLELVSGEISAGRGEQLVVILVDPGRGMGDVESLLERVRARVAEPILLGEGAVFGMVLGGVEERAVESAAGRALAMAGSPWGARIAGGGGDLPCGRPLRRRLTNGYRRSTRSRLRIREPEHNVSRGRR